MEQQTVSSTTPAASSPAPVTAEALHASMTSEERSTWQQTGDLPDRVRVAPLKSDVPAASSAAPTIVEPTPAASSPATPGEPATDDTPASSAAPEPSTQKKPGHKGNADTRIQQLLLENARLQGQLESLSKSAPKTDVPPASSASTAPTQKDWQRIMAQPDAPKEADFDSFAEFTAAASYYVTKSVLKESEAHAQADTAAKREIEAFTSSVEAASRRIEEYEKSHPDFNTKVDSRLVKLVVSDTATDRRMRGEPVRPQHVLAECVLHSDFIAPLVEHFSTADGQREWQSLLSLPPADLLRAFGRLEARFDTAAPSAPAPKTVSTAPAPPQTLGTRTADTADPLEAAIKRKDTAAYIREANKRDLAAMGL